MGLILNVPVTTASGFEVTSGAYLNISEYYINKSSNEIQLAVSVFKDKASREEGKKDFQITEIPSPLRIGVATEELATSNIFTIGYEKLKAALVNAYGAESIEDDV
jgi:hypothetical protein